MAPARTATLGCLAGLACLAATACKERNPVYCDLATPCPAGSDRPFCDLDGSYPASHGLKHVCIPLPPVDAGIDGAFCGGPQSCPPAMPICLTDRCVECVVSRDCPNSTEPICDAANTCHACSADQECLDRGEVHCANDGHCVQCLGSGDCDAAHPYCDPEVGTCRACQKHSECPEQVCNVTTGLCVSTADIIYVDASGGHSGSCKKDTPCATIGDGLSQVTASRRWVRIEPGTYGESVLIKDLEVSLIGPGPGGVITPPALDAAGVVVQGDSVVSVSGLRVIGAQGAASADGVRCEGVQGGATHLALSQMDIESNAGQGVEATSCEISIERSTIAVNAGGGIDLDGSDFRVVNDFIIMNGSADGDGTLFGGVWVNGDPPHSGVFEFNTVVGNRAGPNADSAGVACQTASSIEVRSNIVHGNESVLQVYGLCRWTYSDIGDDPVPSGMGNFNVDPMFRDEPNNDYHLALGSPCIDLADPTSSVFIDYDGNARPQGGNFDMGADEVERGLAAPP